MNKEIDIPHTETETLVEGLSDTFLVRRDLYARQLDDGRYVCIQKFLTPRHVIAHLKGDLTLGAYALNVDNRARFLAFDADDESQWSQLVRMAATLESQGAIAYLEASRRGGHLWLFFSRPVMGRAVREFGLGLVAGLPAGGDRAVPQASRLEDRSGLLDPHAVRRPPAHGRALRLLQTRWPAPGRLFGRADAHFEPSAERAAARFSGLSLVAEHSQGKQRKSRKWGNRSAHRHAFRTDQGQRFSNGVCQPVRGAFTQWAWLVPLPRRPAGQLLG